MLLEKLLKDKPCFHGSDSSPASWAVRPETARFIYNVLTPDMITLETGAGHTTVVFAIAGTIHTCISTSTDDADRIKQYCSKLGVGNNVTFLTESSDLALPCNESIPSELDFIFIDGEHMFPFPIIDWHYTERKLRVGGIVGVDDFKVPSVRVLYDFLCTEGEWELIEKTSNTAFFRKVREPNRKGGFLAQRINSTDKSWQRPSYRFRIERLISRIARNR